MGDRMPILPIYPAAGGGSSLDPDITDALSGANDPSAENPFATTGDVTAAGNLTADQVAAAAGTTGSPSADNLFVTETDPAQSDARDPRAHSGMNVSGIPTTHIGMTAWDTQVRIAPSDFGDTLDGITGDEPTLNDALVKLDTHGHPEADVTFDQTSGHAHTGTGSKQVAYSSLSGAPAAFDPVLITPQGLLYVPPAFISTTTDQAIALTSANHKIALGFTPEVDFALSSLSLYVTAISSTGDISLDIYSDGTAIEPQGELCSNPDMQLSITMTTDSAPSPYVISLTDSADANAEVAGKEAYRVLDGVVSADTGVRSNVAPTGANPIYLTLDLGAVGAKAINRWRWKPWSNASADICAYPKAWTLWGSNEATPTKNTDTDWTQLTGRAAWTAEAAGGYPTVQWNEYYVSNTTPFRWYRWKITDRNGVNDYVALGEMKLFEAESKSAPGTSIQSLGTLAAGSTPDVWVRATFASYQLFQGTKYWLVCGGQDTKSFSLSVRAENTADNSMFPDTCKTKNSTDGGTSWAHTHQLNTLYMPSMLNVVLNSTTHHCPSLMYGRHGGSQVALYESSAWTLHTIPAAGISLDCEALTTLTKYAVYLYNNTGTLTLEAVTTGRVLQDGIEVKSGATSHRFLGIMGALALQTTYQGVLDCPDARLVRNRYNPKMKIARRNPGYVGATNETVYESKYRRALTNNDFRIRLVTWDEEIEVAAQYRAAGYSCYLGVAINGELPIPNNATEASIGGLANVYHVRINTTIRCSEGWSSVYMVVKCDTAGAATICYMINSTQSANIQLTLLC
jgi:hypothetical protein